MNNPKRNNISKNIVTIFLLLFFGIIGIIYAVILMPDLKYRGYKVKGTVMTGVIYTGDIGTAPKNDQKTYIKEFGTCKVLSDTSTNTFFVPTKTSDEWLTYILNKPSTTNLGSCGCKSDSDCGVGKICVGYIPPGTPSCKGTYQVTVNGICEGTVAGSNCGMDGTNCNVYEESECGGSRCFSHGCTWDSNYTSTSTYSCSSFTQSTCTVGHPGCRWYSGSPEELGSCILDSSGDGTTSCAPGTPAACFVAGTQVKLPDNSTINIEDITQSMQVLGANNEIQTVQKPLKIRYTGKLYTINNSDYFVTASHPFMTTQGWKSFAPDITKTEIPDLLVTKLEIGDILVKEKGLEKLYKTDYKEVNQYVYNLVLDGDHTYYADNYLVHNKLDLGPGCTYNVACASNACVGGSCVSSTTTPSVNACCSCTVKAQCPVTYDCISGKCTKTGVTCSSTSVSLCGACTSTSQCPVNSYCNTQYDMCRPSSGPPCAL